MLAVCIFHSSGPCCWECFPEGWCEYCLDPCQNAGLPHPSVDTRVFALWFRQKCQVSSFPDCKRKTWHTSQCYRTNCHNPDYSPCKVIYGRTSVCKALHVFIRPHNPHKRPCMILVSMTLIVKRLFFQMFICHIVHKVRWKAMIFVKGPDLFSSHFERLGHSDACHRTNWSTEELRLESKWLLSKCPCDHQICVYSCNIGRRSPHPDLEFNPDGVFQVTLHVPSYLERILPHQWLLASMCLTDNTTD